MQGKGASPRTSGVAARIVIAVLAASALASFYELRTYRRHVIHLGRLDPAWLDLALAYLSLWARSLAWLAVPTGLAVLCALRRRPGLGVGIGFAACSIVLLWLVVDARLMRVTGAHIHTYLGFVLVDGGRQWGADVTPVTRPLLRVSLGAAGFLALVWGLVFQSARLPWVPRPRLGVPLVAYALVPAALLAGRGLLSQPLVLERLYEVMPLRTALNDPARVPGAGSGGFGVAADEAFLPAAQLFADRLAGGAELRFVPEAGARLSTPARRPHVLLFLLESLRHDAVEPATMPRLARWSQGGLVASRHSSGSNRSDMGAYALLHGRLPLEHPARAQRAERSRPALVRLLRAAGYRSTLVASCPFDWQRMDAYFDVPPFDAQHIHAGELSWPDRDRACLESVRRILADAEGRPQLVVVFLMSTHWSYAFPPSYAQGRAFEPGAHWNDRDRVTAAGMRARYDTSLRFLDDELGALVASLPSEEHLVIVTGDHGESFREDGVIAHATKLSDAQTRTAFLMVGPGIPAVRRSHVSSHLDLVPTLTRWLHPRGVALANADGVDLLAGEVLRPQLLVGYDTRGWEAAVVQADRRLLLRYREDPLLGPRLRVTGFADAEAFVTPGLAQPPDRIPRWTRMLEALLRER